MTDPMENLRDKSERSRAGLSGRAPAAPVWMSDRILVESWIRQWPPGDPGQRGGGHEEALGINTNVTKG